MTINGAACMHSLYLEVRNLPTNPPATLAADIARHLQLRQYLGTALVVCDNPTAVLSATRKQWLKATRYLQRLRASTLNAEEILRLTHAIMHMQNMQFVSKTPTDIPDAAAYFTTPDKIAPLPAHCYSVYLTLPLSAAGFKPIIKSVPDSALVISYDPHIKTEALKFQTKTALEKNILTEWERLCLFLRNHDIEPTSLVRGNNLQFAAMDEALDVLLGINHDFLQRAAKFQHIINLGQPFSIITSEQQKVFEAVTRLAHRVQALTPGNFNNYLVTTFGDNGVDTFFLRDAGSELYEDLEIAASSFDLPGNAT